MTARLRFWRRIRLLPGVTMNVGKTGVTSFSFGIRGAHLTFGRKHRRATIGIPGSGLFVTDVEPYRRPRELSADEIDKVGRRELSDDEVADLHRRVNALHTAYPELSDDEVVDLRRRLNVLRAAYPPAAPHYVFWLWVIAALLLGAGLIWGLS